MHTYDLNDKRNSEALIQFRPPQEKEMEGLPTSPNYRTNPVIIGILVFMLLAFSSTGPGAPRHDLRGLSTRSEVSNQENNGRQPNSHQPCAGYQLKTISDTPSGLKGQLTLIGDGCNKFDRDIANLTIEVTYETQHRLHVHIYDTAQKQFQIPVETFPLPTDIDVSAKAKSALAFEHSEGAPFEFWIRRTDGSDDIIFDSRSFPLVFEKQYIQISSHLPDDANIFGLGEYVASSGFRRDPYNTTQTFWARDAANPVDENEYGVHAVHFEHRYGTKNGSGPSQNHGVFLKNPHGMDILLRKEVIEYRAIGGTLDFYFFAGPTPIAAIEQYVQLVGLPELKPYWSFGFQLCRWGYTTLEMTREAVRRMRESGIPLEVQWNDIDYMLAYQNFRLASDKSKRFPIEDTKAFIAELHSNHQYYIPIIDAALHKVDPKNKTDIYDVYTSGAALGTYIKNPDGSEYIGKVWPGYTVWPDWFAQHTQDWWTQAFRNFSSREVDFDGIWLDMNEPSSFCEGSCGSNANLSNIDTIVLPGQPGQLVTEYPEGYNSALWGPSGDMIINGISTFIKDSQSQIDGSSELNRLKKRQVANVNLAAASDTHKSKQSDQNLDHPGYAIHNGNGVLNNDTVAVNATHANGLKVYHTHNLWGHMEALATHKALLDIHPDRRPFIVSRSTFASGGRKTAHWLGDNHSTWQSMRFSIQGVLQFQAFGIPMVGPDTCGFQGNTNEELCNRWMMLSAFFPFYRNHNTRGSIGQEPYRWKSVTKASVRAIRIRYRLLPYFYSEMAMASFAGTPPIRALFWEFPNDASLIKNDRQFMFGRSILVSPVLEPNVTVISGMLPGGANELWRDWYTLEEVNLKGSDKASVLNMPAPISHINLHIRGGSILLMHLVPGYTTYETQQGPFELLIAMDGNRRASAKVYIDDGHSYTPKSAWLELEASKSRLKGKKVTTSGFTVTQKLARITLLGLSRGSTAEIDSERTFQLNGQYIQPKSTESGNGLVFDELDVDLNTSWELTIS